MALVPDVVVVGTSIDPHIEAVLKNLTQGTCVRRINVDQYPAEHRLSILESCGQLAVEANTDEVPWSLTGAETIWFRRLGKPDIDRTLPEEIRKFAGGEAEETLVGALSVARPKRWLNEYWATRRAANKPFQYSIARAVGLTTPQTLITSDPLTARSFLSEMAPQQSIYKTLHSPVIELASHEQRGFIFTSVLEPADLADLPRLKTAPCQFQELVEVDHELRVTSISDNHTCVRIDGAPKDSKVRDWRAEGAKVAYSHGYLPPEIQAKLSELMMRLGIQFGASDWIVTPDGQFIFLEINPHGAWLWLEQALPTLEISASIASFLEAGFTVD